MASSAKGAAPVLLPTPRLPLLLLLLIIWQPADSLPQQQQPQAQKWRKDLVLEEPPPADSATSETAVVRQVSVRRSNAIPKTQVVKIANLTRQHEGDEFQAHGVNTCSSDVCIGLTSGTAALSPGALATTGYRGSSSNLHADKKNACKCQCMSHSATFREDLDICVDDIHECTLAPFVSGSSAEKIPFVFLPLHGQIIHPSREIVFPGVLTPICAVTGSQYLTKSGWSELRNPIDSDVPFRLFRDEGRTFIQWLGTPELRERMEGRLVLVHLLCRDAVLLPVENLVASSTDKALQGDTISETGSTTAATNVQSPPPSSSSSSSSSSRRRTVRQATEKRHDQQMFTPCIAFRVAGTPMKYVANVTEVSFQSESTSADASEGLTTREYIVIGICSLLLGLIYVASVLLYLHMKKRKRNHGSSGGQSNNTLESAKTGDDDVYKNDQVAFGHGFMRMAGGGGSSIYGSKSGSSIGGGRNSQRNGGSMRSLSASTPREEMGIIKSNPLLKHFPNLNDSSDVEMNNSSNNELDDDSVRGGSSKEHRTDGVDELDAKDSSGNLSGPEEDCLPEENVSIVDEMSNEDKLETMKAIVNGTIRRKLYFNPAYFEPDLLVSPPPAAIEFLNKIREVITIAKYKMATKRYQPCLIDIPEELQGAVSDIYAKAGLSSAVSRKSSVISHSTAKNKDCEGCPGCEEDKPAAPLLEAASTTTESVDQPRLDEAQPPPQSNCKNCGDKRNSIRKWLEGVSTGVGADAENSDAEKSDGPPERLVEVERPIISKSLSDSSSSSDSDTIKANSVKSRSLKGKAPPTPLTVPPPPSIARAEVSPVANSNSLRSSTAGSTQAGPKIVNASRKPEVVGQPPARTQPPAKVIPYGRPTRSPPHPTTPPPPPPTIVQKHTSSAKIAPPSTAPPRPPTHSPPKQPSSVEEIYPRGSEIYNNPQFRLGSPELPPRNQHAPMHGQKIRPPKRMEVSDQYANTSPFNLFKNMPDMIYEAMANDYNLKHLPPVSPYGSLKMPTPDYNDDTDPLYEQYKYARNRSGGESPYVPTPDYNTYGRTKKRDQPDSPIYTRKSPHHLIVDYETDSLERSASKAKTNTSSGSDVSSHPSPSLSSALPMEEEVEIGNAVYDKMEGFRKDAQVRRNHSSRSDFPHNASEVYAPTGQGLSRTRSKIKYNVPQAGSMTIELDHHPSEYEMSTDSEQFEPDTLDRKPKNSRGPGKQVNTWNERFIHNQSFLFNDGDENNNSPEDGNLNSLPDINYLNEQKSRLVLRSSGSFKKDGQAKFNNSAQNFLSSRAGEKTFGSLREIYEAKNVKNSSRPSVEQIDFSSTIAGRILSLEEKHARRQRQISEESLMRQKKRIPPPDVVPAAKPGSPADHPLYDYPKKANSLLMAKNLTAWNTRNGSANDQRYRTMGGETLNHDTDTCDTLSTNSDATDLTGVSETNANSEFEHKKGRLGSASPKDYIRSKDGCYINELEGKSPQAFGILESFMSLGEINNKHYPLSDHMKEGCALDDSDSSRPSTIKSRKVSPAPPIGAHLTSPRVFRVEVNTNTNGMQIALGLLEKKKKSKDLKNAFKKLVNRATSRFGGGNKSDTQDSKTDDEGVSSIIEDRKATTEEPQRVGVVNGGGAGGRSDVDCGYISADSNESKIYGRKFYDRFNFKQVGEKLNEGAYVDLDVVQEREANADGEEQEEADVIEDDDDESTLKGDNDSENETEDHYNYVECDKKEKELPVITQSVSIDVHVPPPPPPPMKKDEAKVEVEAKSEILCTGDHSIIEIKGNSPQPELSSLIYGKTMAHLEYDPELLALEETDDDDGGGGVSSGLSSDESDDNDEMCESGAESIETNSVFFKQMRK